ALGVRERKSVISLVLIAVIAGQSASREVCLARWSIGGVVPGMKAASLQTSSAAPLAEEPMPTVVIQASRRAGFASKVTVSVCVDANGEVSLLKVSLDGSRNELRSDMKALDTRWSS